MVWTRASLALAACLLATAAQAQEPLWRGTNPDGTEIVPTYAGNLSPFPMVKASDELLPPPVFNETALSDTDRQAIEAASILTEIRKVLKADIAFTPDFSLVRIKAVTIGPKGATVLIGSNWQKQGSLVFVPMMQNGDILNLMARLQALDPNLANVVREEVNSRVTSKGPTAMRLSTITREKVELTDSEGKNHQVPFVSSGW